MKAQVIKFPNRFLPAIRRDEPCTIVILPVVRAERFDSGEVSPLLGPRIECPKIAELRRQSKRLREHFKPKFSGVTGGGGDHLG